MKPGDHHWRWLFRDGRRTLFKDGIAVAWIHRVSADDWTVYTADGQSTFRRSLADARRTAHRLVGR